MKYHRSDGILKQYRQYLQTILNKVLLAPFTIFILLRSVSKMAELPVIYYYCLVLCILMHLYSGLDSILCCVRLNLKFDFINIKEVMVKNSSLLVYSYNTYGPICVHSVL